MPIYMDNAATTRVDPRVLEKMLPYFTEQYGNASSLHTIGQKAKDTLEFSRSKFAQMINAQPKEIIFTSGGTESDNLAIQGAMRFMKKNKRKTHVITSVIEHHAVLNTCKYLESAGFGVTYLKVDKYGRIDIDKLQDAITPETGLITIMHANNEIGTIQNIKAIGDIAEDKDILFHTDAVQSLGKIPLDMEKLHIDLMSMSSHKIYGPKGIGALYIRSNTKLEPLIYGGGHERRLRSGTENIPGIVGFTEALRLCIEDMDDEVKRLRKMRDKLIKNVLEIPDSWLNGHPVHRLPGNANFGFRYIEGESLILYLNMRDIAASTGSACSSHSLEPSHVLLAIGLRHEEAHGSLRISLGRFNKEKDIDYLLEVLPETVDKLRKMSALGGK